MLDRINEITYSINETYNNLTSEENMFHDIKKESFKKLLRELAEEIQQYRKTQPITRHVLQNMAKIVSGIEESTEKLLRIEQAVPPNDLPFRKKIPNPINTEDYLEIASYYIDKLPFAISHLCRCINSIVEEELAVSAENFQCRNVLTFDINITPKICSVGEGNNSGLFPQIAKMEKDGFVFDKSRHTYDWKDCDANRAFLQDYFEKTMSAEIKTYSIDHGRIKKISCMINLGTAHIDEKFITRYKSGNPAVTDTLSTLESTQIAILAEDIRMKIYEENFDQLEEVFCQMEQLIGDCGITWEEKDAICKIQNAEQEQFKVRERLRQKAARELFCNNGVIQYRNLWETIHRDFIVDLTRLGFTFTTLHLDANDKLQIVLLANCGGADVAENGISYVCFADDLCPLFSCENIDVVTDTLESLFSPYTANLLHCKVEMYVDIPIIQGFCFEMDV